MSKRWTLPLCGLLLACANDVSLVDNDPALSQREQSIVYGADDRRDLYEEEPAVRELARNAVLALVHRQRISIAPTGEVKLKVVPLGLAYDLCDGERFREQPTAADCTAVLIDDDLVVTAGHCLEGTDCRDYRFVFDYFYRAEKELEPIGTADVYSCRKLVAQEISARNGREIDYAVVQLDRPARDRRPLPVSTLTPQTGQPLLVLGTGSGLPIKADQGASVLDPRSAVGDYFMLEADTFEGSSGSAILNAQGALAGILVRGGEDYVESASESCQRVNRMDKASLGALPGNQLAHEEATYAAEVVAGICKAGFPTPRLCNIEPRCGDGYCTGDESRTTCAKDCDPCQDGVCSGRGSLASGAGTAVKQSAGSGRANHAGCALAADPSSAPPSALWLALGTLLWRRRRCKPR